MRAYVEIVALLRSGLDVEDLSPDEVNILQEVDGNDDWEEKWSEYFRGDDL